MCKPHDLTAIAVMQPDDVAAELDLQRGHHSEWAAEQKWMRVAVAFKRELAEARVHIEAMEARLAELEKKEKPYVPIAQRPAAKR